MNSKWMVRISGLAAVAVLMVAQAAIEAQTQSAESTRQAQAAAEPAAKSERELIVSLADRKLALVVDGRVEKIYTVAVGKPSTPSPEGSFTIRQRAKNPIYSHNGRVVAPGPRNPVGSRWMGLSISGYGIHGTNEPNSIGRAASHGCIRMGKADIEDLYERVAVGDTVRLVGQPDAETARLFAPEPPAAEPEVETVLLAGVEIEADETPAAR